MGDNSITASRVFLADFEDCLAGKADLKDKLEPWFTLWGQKNQVSRFMDYWFERDAVRNNLVIDLISATIPRDVCFLATNQEYYRAHYLMQTVGLQKICVDIFAAWQLGYIKPNASFFTKIMDRLKERFPKENKIELFFVDDLEKNVKMANSLGWHTHHYVEFNDFKVWLQESL